MGNTLVASAGGGMPLILGLPDEGEWAFMDDRFAHFTALVVFHAFTYLPAKGLALASRVCKHWHQLAEDERYATQLLVREFKPSCKSVEKTVHES